MKIYKVTSKQYTSLINDGSLTVNGVVYTYDPNSLYSIVDQAQDEYTLAYDKKSSHLQLNKNGDIYSDINCADMLVGHANNADHAASLTNGSTYLTVNTILDDLDNKLDKVTNATDLQAYTTTKNGVQSTLSITDIPSVGFIPKYNARKSITVTNTPTSSSDAASKKYVDDAITGLSDTYATKTIVDNKVDKVTSANTYDRVYVVKSNGTQGVINIDTSGSNNTVAIRNSAGNLCTQTPTVNTHCANKQYVDNSISTALGSCIKSIILNDSTLTPTNNTINLGNLALATHTHKSADITDSIPLIAGSNISLTSSNDGITIAAAPQTGYCLKFSTTNSSYGGYQSNINTAQVSPYLPMFFSKGMIIDSYTHDLNSPGLMVQHISGITNTNTAINHDKAPLYLNYDGTTRYARPVVLGSGSYGSAITKTTTTSTTPQTTMGYTYSAIRGDQMVNYVQACLPNITLSTNGSAATKQQNIAFSLSGTELTITVS